LISGGYDNKILMWNVNAATEKYSTMSPLQEFNGHSLPVEDVCWHKFHPEIFGSCGDDRTIAIWDTRKAGDPIVRILAH